jgi:hypothetical protein
MPGSVSVELVQLVACPVGAKCCTTTILYRGKTQVPPPSKSAMSDFWQHTTVSPTMYVASRVSASNSDSVNEFVVSTISLDYVAMITVDQVSPYQALGDYSACLPTVSNCIASRLAQPSFDNFSCTLGTSSQGDRSPREVRLRKLKPMLSRVCAHRPSWSCLALPLGQ